MDSRCTKILIELINSKCPLSIKKLSDRLNVSTRTIQHDLDKIDDFLMTCQLPKLDRKPGFGISIHFSMCELKALKTKVANLNNYEFTLSAEERQQYIATRLIKNKGFTTIQQLANDLLVSRSTVMLDLKDLKKKLERSNVKVISKTHFGIKIGGDERNIRRVLINMVSGPWNQQVTQNYRFLDHIDLGLNKGIKNLFVDIDINFIERCVCSAEQQLDLLFSDAAYKGIVLHICMAIQRIRNGKDIVFSTNEISAIKNSKEFAVAANLANMLARKFHIKVPQDEIGYITVHFLGASSIRSEGRQKDSEYEILTLSVIGIMSQLTKKNLSIDSVLYNGLIAHIGPAIYRMKHEIQLDNPLYDEVKKSYPGLFALAKQAVLPVEKYAGEKMSANEVSYFVLLFAAALERYKSALVEKHIKKVLIVCSTGIGSAQILSTRIQSIFQVNILQCIGVHSLRTYLRTHKHHIDLIISTIPLPVSLIKSIVVNPLLEGNDVIRLEKYLKRRNTDRSIMTGNSDYQKILNIIQNNCKIINHKRLNNELMKIFGFTSREEECALMLKDVLTQDVIRLHVNVSDWEDAVRKCGELLVEAGKAKPAYVEAMVQSVKTVGPYIVVAPGIAMPHARPESGAISTGFSLITLNRPVKFGNSRNDPVSIVVCICSSDNTSHIKALSDLVNLLGNEANVLKIKEARDVSAILELIQNLADVQQTSNIHSNLKIEGN